MITIRCPGCDATSAVPETDVGMAALCLRCGARYVVPAPTTDDLPSSEATTISGAILSSDASLKEVAPDWQDDVPAPRASPSPRASHPSRGAHAPASPAASTALGATAAGVVAVERRTWRLWLPIAALLVAGGVIGAAVIAAMVPIARWASRPAPPPPDAIDYLTARSIKEDAESLAIDGRLEDAHRKYQQLFDRAGEREPRDPRTRQLLEAARSHREKLYEALLARATERSRPAAPPEDAPAPQQTAQATTQPSAVAGDATTAAAAPPVAPEPDDAARHTPVSVASVPPPAPSVPTTKPTIAPAPAATQLAATRPASRPATEPLADVTDHQIGQAIRKGVDYLLAQFSDTTHALKSSGEMLEATAGGENALAVYALLQCGLTMPNDERLQVRGEPMRARIDAMKRANLTNGHPQVYALGIRATALALYNRKEDQQQLREDVARLVQAHSNGAYSYSADPKERQAAMGIYDNSNSQYGLLGVWSGAEAGIEIPSNYWAAVHQHWESTQLQNGQWNYSSFGGDGTLSMTVAGIASLFVTHDWLYGPKSGAAVGRPPFSPPLKRGLEWLETGDNYARELQSGGHNVPYTMYGIERVGLASGFKYFGEHDWYRELSREAVLGQGTDGSWNGTVIDTSFVLLFLARGRHPILMNKLRLDGMRGAQVSWANRPRDVANLARFASRQLERELNWQVVPLSRPWQEWLDAPVLYLASHKPVEMTENDYDNLRSFVNAGGLLFTHADGDSPSFNQFAEDLARRLFPRYELRDLHQDHDVYTAVFKLERKPRLRVVENGSRLLIVHSTTDLARYWQLRDRTRNRDAFELGVNLFIYAAGKRDLRNRLESTFIADPGPPARTATPVARLSYPGNWEPEPYAWTRFARAFQGQTDVGLAAREVRVSALRPGEAAVAHLTGTARHDFNDADAKALRAFVEAGGVLFIDRCGGAGAFDDSVKDKLLPAAFPAARLEPLTTNHPLFHPIKPGMQDLTAMKLRPYALEKLGKDPDPRVLLLRHGKGHVIFTPLDVTSGLLGTRTWGILGYEPDYAEGLLRNVVLWTLNGQPEAIPPPL